MATAPGPERLFELLWRTRQPPSRGPKPSLSLDAIVEAAIEIADSDGLGAVTMRRVAERFGVTTMSLYRYVPSKDDLVELMIDAVAAPAPDPLQLPEHWRDALLVWARQNVALFRQHPWVLSHAFGTPPMGPNRLRWMEAALQTMEGTGLTEDDKMGVLVILSGYVLSAAQQELVRAHAASRSRVDPEEWERAYGRLLGRVVNDGRHPALARVVAAGVFDSSDEVPDADFEYGLAFILDGVSALIAKRRSVAPR